MQTGGQKQRPRSTGGTFLQYNDKGQLGNITGTSFTGGILTLDVVGGVIFSGGVTELPVDGIISFDDFLILPSMNIGGDVFVELAKLTGGGSNGYLLVESGLIVEVALPT